jgi:hypothetical protein
MLGGFYALARSVGWVRGKRDERGSVVNTVVCTLDSLVECSHHTLVYNHRSGLWRNINRMVGALTSPGTGLYRKANQLSGSLGEKRRKNGPRITHTEYNHNRPPSAPRSTAGQPRVGIRRVQVGLSADCGLKGLKPAQILGVSRALSPVVRKGHLNRSGPVETASLTLRWETIKETSASFFNELSRVFRAGLFRCARVRAAEVDGGGHLQRSFTPPDPPAFIPPD